MKSRHHPDFKQAQTTIEFLLGPIKIKDGLFMGDQLAARDIEFIISNKVTHVINTVSKVIPNLYERFGVHYLSVHWTEKQENIFDKKNNALNAIFTFIEEAMDQGQSCLIHSINGKSRACAVLMAYLMKKYSWSLSKCEEFVTSKKQNLQIRNNFWKELQDLEKRILEANKLSTNWNQIKNEEDLILANTFYNSKKYQLKQPPIKRNPKKKVVWDEKLVHKPLQPPQMSATMTKFKQSQEKPPAKKLKSILKGHQNEQKEDEQPSELQSDFQGQQVKLADDRFISTINGNIVHVTVNNFITTQKKPQNTSKVYNTRPYSSDNKERDKKVNINNPVVDVKTSKLFSYDNMATTFKNPYEMKMIGKIGSNNKIQKKKEQIKNPVMAYERPQSANIAAERKKMKINQLLPTTAGGGREEMMVTGLSNKKRYPSTNPKDDSYKWK